MKQYPDYLVHYNKNHSKANGQFVSGDGDGDGQINDHAQRSERDKYKSLGPAERAVYRQEMKKKERAKLKATRKKIINEQKSAWQKKSKGDKAFAILGTAAAATAVIGLGTAMVIDHRNEKLRQEIRAEDKRRAQEVIDRARASKAKFSGGDW